MPSAVVHCSKEFVPGLIYVAVSRVKSDEHIQVLNFKPSQLLKALSDVISQCSTDTGGPVADLTCCRHKTLDESLFKVEDRFEIGSDAEDGNFAMPEQQFDQIVNPFFGRPGWKFP